MANFGSLGTSPMASSRRGLFKHFHISGLGGAAGGLARGLIRSLWLATEDDVLCC